MCDKVSEKSKYFLDSGRVSIKSLYCFNGFASFIDILNHDLFNTEKVNISSYYYFFVDEGDHYNDRLWLLIE